MYPYNGKRGGGGDECVWAAALCGDPLWLYFFPKPSNGERDVDTPFYEKIKRLSDAPVKLIGKEL